MSHPFFREINWDDLRSLKIKPPYKPPIKAPDDCSNIDSHFTNEGIILTPETTSELTDQKKM